MELKEMIEDLKGLKDNYGKAIEELKKAGTDRDAELKKFGEATSETKGKIDKIIEDMGEFRDLKTSIDQIEMAIKRGLAPESKGLLDGEAEYKDAFFGALRAGTKEVDPEVAAMGVKLLRTDSNPDGGYLCPPSMEGRIIERMYETSPMRAVAFVQTGSQKSIEGYYDDDELEATWEDELSAGDADKTPQVGMYDIPAHTLTSRPRATQNMIEDSAWNIEEWLFRKLSDKFSRKEAAAFINGNGVRRPRGLITYDLNFTEEYQREQLTALAGVGGAGVLSDEDITKLPYRIQSVFRGNGSYAMNRKTIGETMLLKDPEGRYYWQPSFQAGEPDRLRGYPVLEFNDLPDIATGNIPILFGDFAEWYTIYDRLGISILVDPFTLKPRTEYFSRKRVGGAMANSQAGAGLQIQ